MEKRNPYTAKDDKLILDTIAKYPNNIKYALESAAQQMGRTAHGVGLRYYKYLRNNTTVIAVASKAGVSTINNQKNAPIYNNLQTEDIVAIIKAQIKRLPRKHKLEIVNSLFGMGA